MRRFLDTLMDETGHVPLGWAGSTLQMDYLNFGDALSPVMVALLAGKPVQRVPSKSASPRMAAVGTVGHGFAGGDVWFWGTGCSSWENPSKAAAERKAFTVPPETRFHVNATRGPVSEMLLNGGRRGTGIYGDPVWLLPRFYQPPRAKTWKLGCILHLSELDDRALQAHPRAELQRYNVPDELRGDVRLINTVTAISIAALKDKIDEICACERIVSTSLHGMVIAEAYGIPCLYFSPAGDGGGAIDLTLDADSTVDLRVVDLYRGLGRERLRAYAQPRAQSTDWAHLMRAVDDNWQPTHLPDADALVDALPVTPAPLQAREGETIWEHPLLAGLQLQHDVAQLRRDDRALTEAQGVA